jgi:threonine synthase
MWKAFAELEAVGWLEDASRPRMYACQSDGCAPIVTAYEAGTKHAEPFANAHTIASGLRVPKAVGDFMILDAVRESGGAARSAPEGELVTWMRRASALEGISLCPETAACLSVLWSLVREGAVRPDEEVVVFNTGAAQKYVEAIETELPRLARGEEPRWSELAGG